MKLKGITSNILAAITICGCLVVPGSGFAQNYQDRDRDRDRDRYNQNRYDNRYDQDRYHNNYYRSDRRHHRQDTKNEWRNIAIGAGALGVLGALSGDRTLAFAGAAGSLYSLNRYEQDRRSQRREERLRAEYFSRPYFYRDGHRYARRTVYRNGSQYYRFVREY